MKRRGRALGSLERRKGGRKGENGSFVCTTEQQRGNEEEEEEDGGEEEGGSSSSTWFCLTTFRRGREKGVFSRIRPTLVFVERDRK